MELAEDQGVLEAGVPSVWAYDRADGEGTKIWADFRGCPRWRSSSGWCSAVSRGSERPRTDSWPRPSSRMRRSSNRAGAGARSTRGARGNPDRRQGVRIEPTRRFPPSARVRGRSPTGSTPRALDADRRRRASRVDAPPRRADARPRYHGEASPARGRRPRRTVGGGTITRPAASGARGADRREVRSPPCRCARAREEPLFAHPRARIRPRGRLRDAPAGVPPRRSGARRSSRSASRFPNRAPRLGSLLLRGRRRAPSRLPRFPERP